jgi:PAS domain S-box-containing protein
MAHAQKPDAGLLGGFFFPAKQGYLVAAICVAAATLLRFLLDPLWGDLSPYITYFAASVALVWLTSTGPAASGIVLSFFLANYFFVAPRGNFLPQTSGRALAGAMYFFIGLTMLAMARRARRAIREARKQGAAAASAEALRAQTESRYQTVVEGSPEAVLVNRQGRLVYANPACRELFGARGDELIGTNALELFHPDCHELIRQRINTISAGQRVPSAEEKVVRLDGTLRDVEAFATRLEDDQGGAILVFLRDITDRKRAQDELRRRAEEVEALMEAAPVAIWVAHDPQCHRITGNQRANEFYEAVPGENVTAGPPPGETVQLRRFFQHGRELKAEELPMQQAAASNTEVRNAEIEVLLPSGRKMVIVGSAIPLRDEQGQVRGCLAAFLDLTEHKRLELELERLVEQRTASLRETTEQLNSFCYSIAHDLKAPLRAQAAFGALLIEDFGEQLGPQGRDYASRIVGAAHRQGKLVNDLLAHMSLGRSELPIHQVELSEALKQVMADLRQDEHYPTAQIDCSEFTGRVKANTASLHLVLQNLLSNACKFVAPGVQPQLKLRCEDRGAFLRLWFEDNGIGIDPRFFDKLFGVFQRLHTTGQYPGTGMGLAIVKRGAERMGGRVGVESEVGKGSRFWVELPKM